MALMTACTLPAGKVRIFKGWQSGSMLIPGHYEKAQARQSGSNIPYA